MRQTLEHELRDMQDIEFTVEHGRLYMLQTRNGKRTGLAAIRIAVEMVDEGLITPDEALMRVEPEQLNQLLRPIFSPESQAPARGREGRVLAKGLAAGPGAATGKVVFNAPDAEAWAARGEKVLLVRIETSPEDIRGMDAAQGILTARGGMTATRPWSPARWARSASSAARRSTSTTWRAPSPWTARVVKEGDWLSIDGFTGEVILGQARDAALRGAPGAHRAVARAARVGGVPVTTPT